jgi:hypothetical protein
MSPRQLRRKRLRIAPQKLKIAPRPVVLPLRLWHVWRGPLFVLLSSCPPRCAGRMGLRT